MIIEILEQKAQLFINENLTANISKLALKKNNFENIDYKEIINQIVAKKKTQNKLPTWFNTQNIYYPPTISVEQTSSEITAKYKANLISGELLIDLTGGFGVDCFYFAERFKKVIHCEINEQLSTIVKHNYSVLKKKNINCIATNSTDYLEKSNDFYDCIYLDPSRRSDVKGKVFLLNDCLPNLPENLDLYFEKTKTILVKTAPILDISAGITEMKYVKTIHIVAINNEVKEILWVLEKNIFTDIVIITANIEKENTTTNGFVYNEKQNFNTDIPQNYLYEPNAAILKSGEVNSLSKQFKISKLHQHSHLFTSEVLINFPGRRFKIENEFLFKNQTIEKHIKGKKMNITTRNFPMQVEDIRKKYKVADGGNIYSFFTTNQNDEKIVLICTKV